MDYTKDVNKIPYEEYGNMLTSGELTVVQVNYAQGYTIVVDRVHSYRWKVTYQERGFKAILTKVE